MTVTPIALLASSIHYPPSPRQPGARRAENAGPRTDSWRLRAFHVQTGADVHADH
jgi:hypothetical protein